MRILLIKPKHIGDTLLLTPTIVALRQAYPAAEIWVVVRRGCEGILAGCPEIDRILTVAAVDKRDRRRSDFWRGLGTLLRLLGRKFDYVFELGDGHRGRLLARLTRTAHRCSVRPATPLKKAEAKQFQVAHVDWEACHRVEKDFYAVAEFLSLAPPIPPLRFARERARDWPPAAGLSDYGVLHTGTRQGFKAWRAEGWSEVGARLLQRFAHVVITCGPAPAEAGPAQKLQRELGPRALCTSGRAGWAEMAGLLFHARLYVGLDTAAMHLAAACGCPAVALFGTTSEVHWAPWRTPFRIVTEGQDAPERDPTKLLARSEGRTMAGITADKVIAACDELMKR